MKCQKCEKTATFHITELVKGAKAQEVHLCEEHAREYLAGSPVEGEATAEEGEAADEVGEGASVSQTAAELARLDQQACPICGITFYEFRNQGRLGCPHDYVCFQRELEPLILNVHGESQHVGKRPKRLEGGTDKQTELIRKRRELKEAIQIEDYERARELRDEIRRVESAMKPAT